MPDVFSVAIAIFGATFTAAGSAMYLALNFVVAHTILAALPTTITVALPVPFIMASVVLPLFELDFVTVRWAEAVAPNINRQEQTMKVILSRRFIYWRVGKTENAGWSDRWFATSQV